MVDGNGGKEEVRKKKCPFLNDWCIGEACALHSELTKNVGGGIQRKIGLCAFNAMVIMLSEINQKTQPPQQKIQLSGLIKGR